MFTSEYRMEMSTIKTMVMGFIKKVPVKNNNKQYNNWTSIPFSVSWILLTIVNDIGNKINFTSFTTARACIQDKAFRFPSRSHVLNCPGGIPPGAIKCFPGNKLAKFNLFCDHTRNTLHRKTRNETQTKSNKVVTVLTTFWELGSNSKVLSRVAGYWEEVSTICKGYKRWGRNTEGSHTSTIRNVFHHLQVQRIHK